MSDSGDSGGEPNVGEENPGAEYFPYGFPYRTGPTIPHYYGNYVRQIFMTVGALMLLIAPFLSESMSVLLPFQLGGAIILVFLAGLTSPRKRWVLILDAVAAAAGIIVFETLALAASSAKAWLPFILLEVVTLSFLFALYFSVKTVRSMISGKLGVEPRFGDFVR